MSIFLHEINKYMHTYIIYKTVIDITTMTVSVNLRISLIHMSKTTDRVTKAAKYLLTAVVYLIVVAVAVHAAAAVVTVAVVIVAVALVVDVEYLQAAFGVVDFELVVDVEYM